jgi:hypothetical protein
MYSGIVRLVAFCLLVNSVQRSFDLGPSGAAPLAGDARPLASGRYKLLKVTFCSRTVSWPRCGATHKGDCNGL